MCSKQCRDQNGFKCHLTSEAHQRQLLLFAENPDAYLNEYSKEFESRFLYILKTSYGGKRVRANDVYQDYIRDKGNVHMNATRWHTLSGFVQYLGRTEKCKIDMNEKGWHIAYIDKEDEVRKQELTEKARQEKAEEEQDLEAIARQIERGKELDSCPQHVATDLVRDEEEKIVFALKPLSKLVEEKPKEKVEEKPSTSVFDEAKSRKRKSEHIDSKSSKSQSQKKSALDEIREIEERKREKRNRKDYWLHEGIVVKIVTKKLGSEYYKAKGVILSLVDNYTAKVELNSGDVIKIDQNYLETVIPAEGREMIIVNGAYRGNKAELLKIHESKFALSLKIKSGLLRDRVIEVPYEDASKSA
uniref:Kin17_mid domain-containing protein n=1 Tax=Steinernema glaseri TaxID=37863 RepID=A0A1I7XYL1_9BILA